MNTVLVVEDDAVLLTQYGRALRRHCKKVHAVTNVRAACRIARSEKLDLVISDLRLGQDSGIALTREVRRAQPSVPVIIVSGYLDTGTVVEAMRAGAYTVLAKPILMAEILRHLSLVGSKPRSPRVKQTPTLARAIHEHVHRVRADCDGNISKAARLLDIDRQAIYRLLKKPVPRR